MWELLRYKAYESSCEDLEKDYEEENKKWDISIGKLFWHYSRLIFNRAIILCETTGRQAITSKTTCVRLFNKYTKYIYILAYGIGISYFSKEYNQW